MPLLEYEYNSEAQQEKILNMLQQWQKNNEIYELYLAQNSKQRQTFWQYREGISESLSNYPLLSKLDISLPIARLPRFVQYLRRWNEKNFSQLELCCFGHIGDGNLHLNLYLKKQMKEKPIDGPSFQQLCRKLESKNTFACCPLAWFH